MKQVQISKTAAKSTAKSKTAAKPSAIKFTLIDYKRPQRGHALFAHTQAFLELSGIADGRALPKSKAEEVIGKRAVTYHIGNGNFTHTSDGITLSEKGYEFFVIRTTADPELHAAYTEALTKGTPNALINVADSKAFRPYA